jgi:7-carboxy-7-deazaguanine synthase
MGIEEGYTYALETQGSVSKSWFELLSYLVLSPKPPSSGNETTPDCIEECVKAFNPDPDDPERHGALKVVVFNNEDYRYAIEMHNQFPELECYLQVGNDWVGGEDVPEEFQTPRFDSVMTEEDTRRFHLIKKLGWLMEKVIADRVYDVRVLPQLHVLVYGNKRGV